MAWSKGGNTDITAASTVVKRMPTARVSNDLLESGSTGTPQRIPAAVTSVLSTARMRLDSLTETGLHCAIDASVQLDDVAVLDTHDQEISTTLRIELFQGGAVTGSISAPESSSPPPPHLLAHAGNNKELTATKGALGARASSSHSASQHRDSATRMLTRSTPLPSLSAIGTAGFVELELGPRSTPGCCTLPLQHLTCMQGGTGMPLQGSVFHLDGSASASGMRDFSA